MPKHKSKKAASSSQNIRKAQLERGKSTDFLDKMLLDKLEAKLTNLDNKTTAFEESESNVAAGSSAGFMFAASSSQGIPFGEIFKKIHSDAMRALDKIIEH